MAVQVYAGNTADPTTVPDQVEKLRGRFALERVVLVGDRGMLTQTQIEHLKQHPGLGWISALRSAAGSSPNTSTMPSRTAAGGGISVMGPAQAVAVHRSAPRSMRRKCFDAIAGGF